MTKPVIKVRGNDYLTKDAAVAAFRADYPIDEGRGCIDCMIIDAVNSVVRAEIRIDGKLVAAAHCDKDGQLDTLRKVEGGAINRALRLAGYTAETYEGEDDQTDIVQRGGQNLQQKENRRIPAPKDGEKRVFMVDAIRSLMNEHGLYYRLHTTDNIEIFAFSRDFAREWGYADAQLEQWKESGFVAKWEKPLPVTAVYKDDATFGGSWRWVAKDGSK